MSSPALKATGASGAVTLNAEYGVITTESLSTAAGSDVSYTLTNSEITTASVIQAEVQGGTNTTVPAYVHKVTPAAGSATVLIRNGHASAALNGTLIWSFIIKN